ncbi:MAG: hypothetical protein MJ095_08580 [Oscillospiraceae bacterium]|nr:hypothetical protein [Oscillospiraceae bacterium]
MGKWVTVGVRVINTDNINYIEERHYDEEGNKVSKKYDVYFGDGNSVTLGESDGDQLINEIFKQ